MVVAKPISRQFFHQAIKLVATSRRRVMGLKSENQRLQSRSRRSAWSTAPSASDPVSEHDRAAGTPLYRKAGDGFAHA